jgi:hypothetical protein
MKNVRELTSLALNALSLMIPILYTYKIVNSLRQEEKLENEVEKGSHMLYNIIFVVALSLIFNSKKIIKLGTF